MFSRRISAAARLKIPYARAAAFSLPSRMRLGNTQIDLHLPSEHGVRVAFLELLLDDCYQLKRISRIAGNVESVLDIGANVGLFGIAARLAFPNAIIHGYEPNAALEPYLARQASSADATYFLEAVGGQTGLVQLDFSGGDSVHASSRLDPNGTVKQVTLRDALTRLGGRVDVLKLDCEGAEWEMLEDRAAWEDVGFVTMEYHLIRPRDHTSIVTLLESCGMQVIAQRKLEGFGLVLARNIHATGD